MVFNILTNDRNLKADCFHEILTKYGTNFATGVPCGVLRHIIRNFNEDNSILHVPANRESEAVGLAVGAYLGGKKPVVYMQNSGLFTVLNDIASLVIPYKIPIFFVVSYRGCDGENAVQHLLTGRTTESMLELLNLPYVVFKNQNIITLVETMLDKMLKEALPMFLLLKRGWHL